MSRAFVISNGTNQIASCLVWSARLVLTIQSVVANRSVSGIIGRNRKRVCPGWSGHHWLHMSRRDFFIWHGSELTLSMPKSERNNYICVRKRLTNDILEVILYVNIKKINEKNVIPDETGHFKPSYLDQHCFYMPLVLAAGRLSFFADDRSVWYQTLQVERVIFTIRIQIPDQREHTQSDHALQVFCTPHINILTNAKCWFYNADLQGDLRSRCSHMPIGRTFNVANMRYT